MELAEKIKQTETERQGMNTWTPERIDKLVQDQNFVQAAQVRLQQQSSLQAPQNYPGSQEEWSALSENEKKSIYGGLSNVEAKINNLLAQQDKLLLQQEDERIKAKIPHYDPVEINQFAQEFTQGKVPRERLRELVAKGLHYEKDVERSYQFGLQDRQGDIQGKKGASTLNPGTSNTKMADEIPQKQEGESPQTWFSRLGRYHLVQARRSK